MSFDEWYNFATQIVKEDGNLDVLGPSVYLLPGQDKPTAWRFDYEKDES